MSGGPVDTADVVIAGAGAGGLTLATILGRAGVRVLVVDPRPAILPVGRGELVQPLGLDVLSDLGLLESLLALPHVRNASFDFLDGQGRILMRSRYDQGEADSLSPFPLNLTGWTRCSWRASPDIPPSRCVLAPGMWTIGSFRKGSMFSGPSRVSHGGRERLFW